MCVYLYIESNYQTSLSALFIQVVVISKETQSSFNYKAFSVLQR